MESRYVLVRQSLGGTGTTYGAPTHKVGDVVARAGSRYQVTAIEQVGSGCVVVGMRLFSDENTEAVNSRREY